MKKLVAILLLGCMISGMLCGCGAETVTENDGNTTITIWHDKEDEVAAILEEKLETLSPEIEVVIEKKSN